MSADVQTAVLNEAFELAHMFRENAALKHGLPNCPAAQRVKSLIEADQPDPPPPPVVNITNNIPARDSTSAADAAQESPTPGDYGVASAKSGSLLKAAAPWLLTAATAGGVGAGVNYWLRDKPVVMPSPAPVAQRAADQDGSLLQFLQDAGKHLPEGAWPTK